MSEKDKLEKLEKLEKLLTEIRICYLEQEKRNKTAEEYKVIAKKHILNSFNSNILYWVDGYRAIIEGCGIDNPETIGNLLGKIRKHQEDGISKWIDFSIDEQRY
jgi:hypothetical protein